MKEISMVIPLAPITKKNSQRIVRAGGRYIPLPSAQYEQYERAAGYYIKNKQMGIDTAVSVKCLFYMPTRRRVDLTNLLEAIDDILVKYGVLADDNSKIIVSHDGSRVLYDKDNPRTEVYILEEVDDQV